MHLHIFMLNSTLDVVNSLLKPTGLVKTLIWLVKTRYVEKWVQSLVLDLCLAVFCQYFK